MASETPVITKTAAVPVKAAPAEVPPKGKAVPEPDRITVRMANATNGARYHGEQVTVDAETGRALIRAGEASPAT